MLWEHRRRLSQNLFHRGRQTPSLFNVTPGSLFGCPAPGVHHSTSCLSESDCAGDLGEVGPTTRYRFFCDWHNALKVHPYHSTFWTPPSFFRPSPSVVCVVGAQDTLPQKRVGTSAHGLFAAEALERRQDCLAFPESGWRDPDAPSLCPGDAPLSGLGETKRESRGTGSVLLPQVHYTSPHTLCPIASLHDFPLPI